MEFSLLFRERMAWLRGIFVRKNGSLYRDAIALVRKLPILIEIESQLRLAQPASGCCPAQDAEQHLPAR